MRVCHVSSVHRGLDVRIFRKECRALRQAGFDVSLIINAKPEDVEAAREEGISLIPLRPDRSTRPNAGGRLRRVLFNARRAFLLAMELRADLYHIHDPELLPFFWVAAVFGRRRVVYDSHENMVEDVLTKEWIPSAPLRKVVSAVVRVVENQCAARFAGLVCATPHIGRRFAGAGPLIRVVNNFPIADELQSPEHEAEWTARDHVCYVGGISARRGVRELIKAIEQAAVPLALAGEFESGELREELCSYGGWRLVQELGSIPRHHVRQVMSKSFAGVVTFKSSPNHRWSQPNKMFEYMSAGLPVVASNFPLWREIVEKRRCGICVDPSDPSDIAGALIWLKRNPSKAREMGENGRRLVAAAYNWDTQKGRLFDLYREIVRPDLANRTT